MNLIKYKLKKPDMTTMASPTQCLTHCHQTDPSKRIAITRNSDECYCLESLNRDQIIQVDDSQCSLPCDQDPSQICGGESQDYLMAFVATCPENDQVRFGDYCYKETTGGDQEILANMDECSSYVSIIIYDYDTLDDIMNALYN